MKQPVKNGVTSTYTATSKNGRFFAF